MSRVDISLFELVSLTSFNFPYGFVCSAMGIVILPDISRKFMPHNSTELLGFLLFSVGVSQLACPVAGKLSDSYQAGTSFGRRRPYIIGGAVVSCLACICMWYTSRNLLFYGYVVSLFVGMIGLNVIYSVQCCLTSDFVPNNSYGKASGLVASLSVAGSVFCFAWLIVTSTVHKVPLDAIYFVIIRLVVISTILQLFVGRRLEQKYESLPGGGLKQPHGSELSQDIPLTALAAECPVTADDLTQFSSTSDYHIETTDVYNPYSDHPGSLPDGNGFLTEVFGEWFDFSLVFCSRSCYYIAISCQSFMMYYTRDVLGTLDEDIQKLQVIIIVLVAQTTAALLSIPFGRLSDKDWISKKMLVYIACCMMSAVYGWFLIAPYFGAQWGFYALVPAAVFYGVGNSCFLAVDYAMALASIPSTEDSGKALGIWGVSFFVGALIGPPMWSTAIHYFGASVDGQVYKYDGYVAMLIGGMIMTSLTAVFIAFVRRFK